MEEYYDIIRENIFLTAKILEEFKISPLPKLPEIAATQYSRGGELLHRGYYCPSLVYDIVFGGAKRGKLLKRFSMPPTYRYGFDKEGNLVVAENIDVGNREIIIRNDDIEVGLTVEESRDEGEKITRISLVNFRGGKIKSYICCDCSAASQIINNTYGEVYEYEFSMLKRVYCSMPTGGTHLYNKREVNRESIKLNKVLLEFEHDADGYLSEYRYTDMHTSLSQNYHIHLKRRA